MAQVCNTSPTILLLYGETLNDLNDMPTTIKIGAGKYKNMGLAEVGSIAQILTSDKLTYYMLRSTGWIETNNPNII